MMKCSDVTSILFIAPLPPPTTGQSIASLALRDDLKRHKHEVRVVNLSKESFRSGFNSLGRVFELIGVVIKVLVARPSTSHAYFTVAESVAGNLKDLLIYLCLLGRLETTYIHLHGGAGMRLLLSQRHPWLRRINGYFIKRLAGVIVLGERLKSIYDGMVPSERLHTVPNFAGDELFVDEASVEAKFSCVKPLRLLFLSNLLPGKGHQELLAALNLLPKEAKAELQVDFAGGFESSDDESAFKQAVQKTEGIAINVHGVVQGEQKKTLFRQAHLFCLPTYYPYEGQPISILEAYASGCAVMTTDHSGIFDTFTPGLNGLAVEKKSPQSIADAILASLENPAQLFEYGSNNLKDALRKYRASTHVEALEKIILSVAR